LDVRRGSVLPAASNGNGNTDGAEITTIVEVPDSVTSQFDVERLAAPR
jgi:hypothetical protein